MKNFNGRLLVEEVVVVLVAVVVVVVVDLVVVLVDEINCLVVNFGLVTKLLDDLNFKEESRVESSLACGLFILMQFDLIRCSSAGYVVSILI